MSCILVGSVSRTHSRRLPLHSTDTLTFKRRWLGIYLACNEPTGPALPSDGGYDDLGVWGKREGDTWAQSKSRRPRISPCSAHSPHASSRPSSAAETRSLALLSVRGFLCCWVPLGGALRGLLWLPWHTQRVGPDLFFLCGLHIQKRLAGKSFGNSCCSLPKYPLQLPHSSSRPNPAEAQQSLSNPAPSTAQPPNPESHRPEKREVEGGEGERESRGLTVPAEWFQAAVVAVSPTRFRRVSTSDTVRLLWVLLEASSGPSPEFPAL